MDCTPQSLITNANGVICCLPMGKQTAAVKLWLLATIAGVSTDPSLLRENAKCLDCVPIGTLLAIRTYLLTIIAGTSQDTTVLANNASCFRANCFPAQMRAAVQVWILTQIAVVNSDVSFLIE